MHDSEAVVATYIVANTPTWLFKRLRASDGVRALARRHSTAQLFSLLDEQIRNQTSIEARALASAYLVALSHKPRGEVVPFLERLKLVGVGRLSDLVGLLMSRLANDSHQYVDITPGVPLEVRVPLSRSSNGPETRRDIQPTRLGPDVASGGYTARKDDGVSHDHN